MICTFENDEEKDLSAVPTPGPHPPAGRCRQQTPAVVWHFIAHPHYAMPIHSSWTTALLGGLLCLAVLGPPLPLHAQPSDSSSVRQQADAVSARADSFEAAREFSSALQAYQRARQLYLRAGASTQAAKTIGQIGVVHYRAGDYSEALAAFREAAAATRAAGAREEGANLLNNIGLIEWRRGQYDQAQKHFRESIELHRTLGNQENVAKGLNNLGNVQDERGQFDLALRNYREALELARTLDLPDDEASYLNNIGLVLRSQGRYAEALRYHRKALKLHRSRDDKEGATAALNNIGIALKGQERYQEALDVYQKALRINREINDPSSIAANLSNIGELHQWEGRHQKAQQTLRHAIRINRELNDRAGVATNLVALGEVYRSRQKYKAALDTHRTALQINRELGRRTGIATALDGIALTYYAGRQYARADSVLQEAISVTETLLETASGTNRRDFVAQEIGRFYSLVMTRVQAGREAAALRAYEQGRARLLAEQIAEEDSSLHVPPVDSLQNAIGEDEAAVLYANTDTERPIIALVVTRDSVRAQEIDEPILEQAERRYASALDRLRRHDETPWAARRPSMLRQAKGVQVGTGTDGTLAALVRLYRHDVSVPPKRQLLSTERREQLGQFFHELLLDPISEEIAVADELIVVPDGALSYLPFEVLQNWNGTRVVEQWRVRYVQSLRVLRLLQQRHAPEEAADRRSLLALGGVVYNPGTYAADTSGLDSGHSLVASARTARPDTISQSERGPSSSPSTEPAATYRELGYGPGRWQNLSGTLTEVRSLQRMTSTSTLLVGHQASERTLHRMSDAGTLDDYRALHFATHGFVVPEEPRLSALVLSEVGTAQSGTAATTDLPTDGPRAVDGYLNMREIATLELDAEFVGLSACRTGLGRIYRGSGAVSLAQAFLRAGAGSVAVSLWAIYDASSSRFMESVYRRAWTYGISWSEAMAQTKRAFAAGHHGERLQAPRFWAPFVHYGWDAGDARRHRASH